MIRLLLNSIMVILFAFHSTAQSSPAWLTTGNAGTSPTVNFVGTTDNADLQFRINNTRVGLLTVNGNIFWGLRSGMNNTTGYSNIGIGTDALKNSTTVTNMVAIGDSAAFNGGSYSSVAIGSKALFAIKSSGGGLNTAVGFQALRDNIGINNTAVGALAMQTGLGSDNTAIGVAAMHDNTVGNNNTAAGQHAMFFNTEGYYNSAFGSAALMRNKTGFANSAFGGLALDGNATGSYNTAIGLLALDNTDANHNTAVGYSALRFNSRGIENTGLGSEVNVGRPDINNATAIGARAQVDCSNCLVLGSVKGINAASNNVNVGIGQTNPGFPLNFADSLGDKISLYGRAGNHYGFGIQPALLQIHTDGIGSDIVFGYGSSNNFTENMRITGFGNLIVRGTIITNGTFYTSDSRLKTNIEPIEDALDKVTQLNGYHYNWVDEQQEQALQSGVLAEEVKQLFPELVRADDKGFLSVNYVGLIPYLIQSVKEQGVKMKKQDEKIDSMQKQIDELRKMVENMKK